MDNRVLNIEIEVDNMIKRKLMKYAMLYLADIVDDAFVGDDEMTVEKFIEISEINFDYYETTEGSSIYGHLVITEHGDIEAKFTTCIAR
jgi:hypothetical protein